LTIRSIIADSRAGLCALNRFQMKAIHFDFGLLCLEEPWDEQRNGHQQYRKKSH
jgi:hypothetical protein